MALRGLHTNWAKGSYVNDRNYFMKQKENPTGPYTLPYYDGSIAIGYVKSGQKGDVGSKTTY
jgi:hypothetical protein